MVDEAGGGVGTEAAGVGEDGDGAAAAVLLFELARAGGGEVGEGFFELGKARYAVVGEAAAGADAFLLGQLVYADAAFAL